MSALICLIYFKMVHKRICSKKYHFVEQDLCELETEKAETAKTGSISTVVKTTDILKMVSLISGVHWLPLTDPFAFNFSFF